LCAFTACRKDDELIEITDDCIFYDTFLNLCFNGSQWASYDEVIIQNEIEYRDFANSVKLDYDLITIDCDTVKLPYVDFDKFTLLAKITQGGSCTASYERRLIKDIKNKRIIYEISVYYKGYCDMLQGSRNFALVPKVAEDYTIIISDKAYYLH
jgi:hypothetical protein